MKQAEGLVKEVFEEQGGQQAVEDKFQKAKLLSATFNNFACIYKRMNKPNDALSYLKDALKVEED